MARLTCTAAPRGTRALHPLAPCEHAAALQAPREDRGTELLQYPTGLPLETLQAVAKGLTHLPAEVTPHPEIQKLMARRRAMVEGMESRVDFSFAEMLAFSTLALRRPPGARPLCSSLRPQLPAQHSAALLGRQVTAGLSGPCELIRPLRVLGWTSPACVRYACCRRRAAGIKPPAPGIPGVPYSTTADVHTLAAAKDAVMLSP